MMNMMFTCQGHGQSSQPAAMNISQTLIQPDASMSTSTFANNWLPPNSAGMDTDLVNNTGMFNDERSNLDNFNCDFIFE